MHFINTCRLTENLLTSKLCGEKVDVFYVHLVQACVLRREVVDAEDQLLPHRLQAVLRIGVGVEEGDHHTVLQVGGNAFISANNVGFISGFIFTFTFKGMSD